MSLPIFSVLVATIPVLILGLVVIYCEHRRQKKSGK